MVKGSSFKVSPDNPVGRGQIVRNLDRHNKFICDAAPYVHSHQSRAIVDHRELCRLRPSWLPTSYEIFFASQMADVMDRLVKTSKPCVDSRPPELAWHHRQLKNIHRKHKLSDPVYWATQGTKIEWSDQDAQNARSAFEQMEYAKQDCKKCIDNELSDMSISYIESKRQQMQKKLPVINVPLVHPEGHSATALVHSGTAPLNLPGSSTAHAAATWQSSASHSREVATGVPDPLGDKLKALAPVKAKPQALPPKLAARTVHNGWDKATNGAVRGQYLQSIGHCDTTNDSQNIVADLSTLVRSNGGKVGVPSQPSSRGSSRLGSRAGSSGARKQACTPIYPSTTCMYSAEVLRAKLTTPGSGELTVRKGELVFVLQDSGQGCFSVVNQEGSMGEVPCNLIKFLQTVPPGRLQPAANGFGPAPDAMLEPLFDETMKAPHSRPESQMSSRPVSRASDCMGVTFKEETWG